MYDQQLVFSVQSMQLRAASNPNIYLLVRADNLFHRTLLQGALQRVFVRLAGRRTTLLNLEQSSRLNGVQGCRYIGNVVVPLKHIVGSECRSHDFDLSFRPVKFHSRERWTAIAALILKGESLPAVDLIRLGEDYYVRDGHHRISVARTLGQDYIDAHVTIWQTVEFILHPAARTAVASPVRA